MKRNCMEAEVLFLQEFFLVVIIIKRERLVSEIRMLGVRAF